ncbi:MAG: hypothetical protein ABEI52_07750 [Halobacteriaceae archaeon]
MRTDFHSGVHKDSFTITVDKPVAEIGEDDEDMLDAVDTKARFLYQWNKNGDNYDKKLLVFIEDSNGACITSTRYKHGGYKIEKYLENHDW